MDRSERRRELEGSAQRREHEPHLCAAQDRRRTSLAVRVGTLASMVGTLLLFGPRANAQSSPEANVPILALEWSAPSECPDRAQMKARVEQLVGRSHGNRTLAANGRMTSASAEPRYRLDLVVGEASPRAMTGADCARLAEAAALILALDIDPDALARVTEPSPPSEPGPPASPAPPPPSMPPPRRTSMPAVEVSLGARILLDHGSLPKAAGGLGLVAEIARRDFSVGLVGAAYRRQFVGGPRDGSAGAYVDLLTLGTQACGQKRLAIFGLRGCLGAELGREETRGVGIRRPGTSSALWAAGLLALEARVWPNRVVTPTLGLTLGHPFEAPDVVIEGFGTLFQPPTVFVRAHLGISVRLF